MEELPKPPKEKELPAPPKELELPAPPQELELPAPNEKLLPAPTFWERNSKKKMAVWGILLIIAVLIVPMPYFQPILPCMPCLDTNPANCKPCPPEGWYFGDPLWKVLSKKLFTAPGQKTATVIPSPAGKPSRITTIAPTIDPLANWQTYVSNNSVYSFKYPQNWFYFQSPEKQKCIYFNEAKSSLQKPNQVTIETNKLLTVCYYPNIMLRSLSFSKSSSRSSTVKSYTINKYSGIRGKQTNAAGEEEVIVSLDNPKSGYITFTYGKGDLNILEQILSTFEFLDQEKTQVSQAPKAPEDQVMCTMDAKQCPDGTWVGRTGPKCEFAPCPGKANK